MSQNLNINEFVASRGMYGTNSVRYKGMEIEVIKYNNDYTNPVTSFDWGNSEKGSVLLAYAILNIIATPTIARVYANKYTLEVIQKLNSDEWKMKAIEVAHWVNNNTNYKIDIGQTNSQEPLNQEAIEKEQRKVQREAEFQKQIEEKLKNRTKNSINSIDEFCEELHLSQEILAKILDVSMEILIQWQEKNEIPKFALKALEFYKAGVRLKEQNTKLKIELQQFQEELIKNQTQMDLYRLELTKYKNFINALNMPQLYKKYKDL